MACAITTGRKTPCKSGVGGIEKIYFSEYGTFGDLTISAGEITDISGAQVWFQYDIKGANSLETAITSSRENGTTFYETTLNVTLPFLEKATQEEIKLLAVNRPHIAVKDYNGNYFIVGLDHGCELSGGTIITGAAMGDLSGFTLSFTAQETEPPHFVTGSNITVEASATQITPN